MSVELDDRIRTLVRRLDELAPMAPELETLQTYRSGIDRSRRLLLPVLLGAAALLIVALVQVAGRPNPPSSASQLVPQSIARDLPDGWAALSARENTTQSAPTGMPRGMAYATADAPFGPIVAFLDQMGSPLDTSLPTVERTRPNGLRTVIGSAFQGNARWVDVEMSPGSWVGFAAAGLTDDELFRLAEQVVVDGTAGRFEGALPHELAVASSTFQFFESFIIYGADTSPTSWPTGMTMTTYGPLNAAADTSISIVPLDANTRIMLGLTRTVTDLGNGTISATTPGDPGAFIYSQRDGHEIWAQSSSLDPLALSRLVLSLSPATESDWTSLISTATPSQTGGAQPPETTAAVVEYPTDTGPQVPSDATRSTFDLEYTRLENGTMSAVLPGDRHVSVQFEAIGRALRVAVTLDDIEVYSGDLDVNDSAGASGGNITGEGSGLYVIAFSTTDPSTEQLSVIDGTTEYRSSYVKFDNSSSVRVAVIVVPARAGRTTPPQVFNLDADGNNLGNI